VSLEPALVRARAGGAQAPELIKQAREACGIPAAGGAKISAPCHRTVSMLVGTCLPVFKLAFVFAC